MNITIDSSSGFCFGVQEAIETAENYLNSNDILYALGDLVHNEKMMQRLSDKGLKIISEEDFKNLENETVLIRAHGVAPEIYDLANKYKINLIDATCPIVTKLQQKIRNLQNQYPDAQILIFGKNNHPEMVGLIGITNNKAIAIENSDDLKKIDFNKKLLLFSQTTMDKKNYELIIDEIKEKGKQIQNFDFTFYKSLCQKVSNRAIFLEKEVVKYDTVIFVSGRNSSNGFYLFQICKQNNSETYFVSTTEDIKKDFFKNKSNILISGANSTPIWLLKEIENYIINLLS